MRFVTLNTWKNEGHYSLRLQAMAVSLAALNADVIALQECFVADAIGADTASALGVALGMHVSRQPMRIKHRLHDGTNVYARSDLAILSRAAPETVGYAQFPGDARDDDRGLLWIDVMIGERPIRCGCTHFTHLRDAAGAAIRSRQAAATLSLLLDGWRGPAMLMGDLNARAKDHCVSAIFGATTLDTVCRASAEASEDIDHVLLFQGRPECAFIARSAAMRPDPRDLACGPSDHPAIIGDVCRS